VTRCIVRRKVDVVAVNFVRRRLVLRFLPSQLLDLDLSPVGWPVDHVVGIVVIARRVVVVGGSVGRRRVTGMLQQSVFDVGILTDGVFGAVAASLKVGTSLTVEVGLLSVAVIGFTLLRSPT